MPLPGEHTQAPILTQWTVFVGHLGFQSITDQYKRPYTCVLLPRASSRLKKTLIP